MAHSSYKMHFVLPSSEHAQLFLNIKQLSKDSGNSNNYQWIVVALSIDAIIQALIFFINLNS